MARLEGAIRFGWLVTVILCFCACGDVLTVSDPNRLTSDDLDNDLAAVANGVEGAVYEEVDYWVVLQALLADVLQSTDTSSVFNAVDLGRIDETRGMAMDRIGSRWARASGAARIAEERFKRVLGDSEAEASALTAQVLLSSGLVNLYRGMTFCSVAENGRLLSDRDVLNAAEQTLTRAIAVARAAQRSDYETAAVAARAQTRAMLLEWAGAASDAAAIPQGFSHDAVFPSSHVNAVYERMSVDRSVGLMSQWWEGIAEAGGSSFLTDPSSGLADPRLPVFHSGALGRDEQTPHYDQRKYVVASDRVPLVHYDLMRLIVAEALVNREEYAGATAILNELRGAVGLPGYAVPGDSLEMQEILVHERFAELFLEGHRLVDLHRKGLMRVVFDELMDPQRPGWGRPSKWGGHCPAQVG